MKAARFPADGDLSGFTFAASEINEALVRQLHRCKFMDAAENVVLIRCLAGHCAAMHERGRTGNGEIACRDRHWHSGHPASPQKRALLPDGRVGQCAGTGKDPEQGRQDRRDAGENRPIGVGRVGVSAVQNFRRCHAVPPSQAKLHERTSVMIITNLSFSEWASVSGPSRACKHMLPGSGCQNDDRPARSPHPSVPYLGDRQRQLPLQGKLGNSEKETEGDNSIDHIMTLQT